MSPTPPTFSHSFAVDIVVRIVGIVGIVGIVVVSVVLSAYCFVCHSLTHTHTQTHSGHRKLGRQAAMCTYQINRRAEAMGRVRKTFFGLGCAEAAFIKKGCWW